MNYHQQRRTNNNNNRSPRQIANKAYNLATKKISSDDSRKKRHYHIRERLLIQHTMMKAKEMLNDQSSPRQRVTLSDPYDWDVSTLRQTKHYPPPAPISLPKPTLSEVAEPSCQTCSKPTFVSPSLPNPSVRKPLTSPHLSRSIFHNKNHQAQWSLFDLLNLPPFIFWSTPFSSHYNTDSNEGKKNFSFLVSPIATVY